MLLFSANRVFAAGFCGLLAFGSIAFVHPSNSIADDNAYIATSIQDFIQRNPVLARAPREASNGKTCDNQAKWCSIDLVSSALFLRVDRGGAGFFISATPQNFNKKTEAASLKDMVAIVDMLGQINHRFPPDWDLDLMKAYIAQRKPFTFDMDPEIKNVDEKRRVIFDVDDGIIFFSFSMTMKKL